jgi:hypothetical protein
LATPIIGDFIEAGMNFITGITNKFAADKNVVIQNETDRIKFAQELQKELTVMLYQHVMANKDLMLKDVENARLHEIELAKLEPSLVRYITSLARGLFRPLIGFATIGSFVWSQFLAPYWGFKTLVLNPYAYGIVGLIATFYYGGRTMEKIKAPQPGSVLLATQGGVKSLPSA